MLGCEWLILSLGMELCRDLRLKVNVHFYLLKKFATFSGGILLAIYSCL